ncbi:DnaJ family domain-containing protein [Ewingella allii]|uniref:DnaJ family domain-containing protein n=1 Tax=Ewingella allii TaxID=3092550 RepID=UPI001853654D|nr:DUF1992 domain-containing protein [Pseudomonas reactans]
MFLGDAMAEQKIAEAINKGELDNLPGAGSPLLLDDDSDVPLELRMAYRILKNSGFLPPELQDRKEALELNTLLQTLTADDARFTELEKRVKLLELRLQQAGQNTDFLRGDYQNPLLERLRGK